MNWRGEYVGGDLIVTSKRWWRLRDRRAAKKAAQILAYRQSEIRENTQKAMRNALLYGYDARTLEGQAVQLLHEEAQRLGNDSPNRG